MRLVSTRRCRWSTFEPDRSTLFPTPDEPTKERIRQLGEQLDGHRKRQQELHADLTMTGMYNVLEKLRAHSRLSLRERTPAGGDDHREGEVPAAPNTGGNFNPGFGSQGT